MFITQDIIRPIVHHLRTTAPDSSKSVVSNCEQSLTQRALPAQSSSPPTAITVLDYTASSSAGKNESQRTAHLVKHTSQVLGGNTHYTNILKQQAWAACVPDPSFHFRTLSLTFSNRYTDRKKKMVQHDHFHHDHNPVAPTNISELKLYHGS